MPMGRSQNPASRLASAHFANHRRINVIARIVHLAAPPTDSLGMAAALLDRWSVLDHSQAPQGREGEARPPSVGTVFDQHSATEHVTFPSHHIATPQHRSSHLQRRRLRSSRLTIGAAVPSPRLDTTQRRHPRRRPARNGPILCCVCMV